MMNNLFDLIDEMENVNDLFEDPSIISEGLGLLKKHNIKEFRFYLLQLRKSKDEMLREFSNHWFCVLENFLDYGFLFDYKNNLFLTFDELSKINRLRFDKEKKAIKFSDFANGIYKTSIFCIPFKYKYIETGAFEGAYIEKFYFCGEDVHISKEAFKDCINLKTFDFPYGTKEIPTRCFFGCMSLKDIKIPDEVFSVNTEAFAGCDSLEEISFGDKLECIWDGAFYNCENLRKINIDGYNLKKVGSRAFQFCKNLENFDFNSDFVKVDDKAFYNCPKCVINIYTDKITSYPDSFGDCKINQYVSNF